MYARPPLPCCQSHSGLAALPFLTLRTSCSHSYPPDPAFLTMQPRHPVPEACCLLAPAYCSSAKALLPQSFAYCSSLLPTAAVVCLLQQRLRYPSLLATAAVSWSLQRLAWIEVVLVRSSAAVSLPRQQCSATDCGVCPLEGLTLVERCGDCAAGIAGRA
eukprot:scpid93473/ scgid27702/ 